MPADDEFLTSSKLTSFYRRKRTRSGSDLDNLFSDQTQLPTKDRGLLCRNCRKWIPWSRLTIEYERQQEDIVRLWVCDCGDVLREDNLTGMEGQYSE